MPRLRNSSEKCFECGREAVHAHHVVPRSLGGTTTVNLCADCHGKVHNRRFTDSSALVKAGLKKLQAKGYHHGVAPYGFAFVNGEKIPVESEIRIAKHIIERKKEGWGNGDIARELNNKGLLKRNGTEWSRGSIWGMLKKHRPSDFD